MEILVNNDPPNKSYDGMLWVRLQTEDATGVWLKKKQKLVIIDDWEEVLNKRELIRAKTIISALIRDSYTYEGDMEAKSHFSVDTLNEALEFIKDV